MEVLPNILDMTQKFSLGLEGNLRNKKGTIGCIKRSICGRSLTIARHGVAMYEGRELGAVVERGGAVEEPKYPKVLWKIRLDCRSRHQVPGSPVNQPLTKTGKKMVKKKQFTMINQLVWQLSIYHSNCSVLSEERNNNLYHSTTSNQKSTLDSINEFESKWNNLNLK